MIGYGIFDDKDDFIKDKKPFFGKLPPEAEVSAFDWNRFKNGNFVKVVNMFFRRLG